jgi:hypothetical protein
MTTRHITLSDDDEGTVIDRLDFDALLARLAGESL